MVLSYYLMTTQKKSKAAFQVGDLVIEKKARSKKKRIGEVIFVREGRRRKLEMVELNKHDLSPLYRGTMEGPKIFSLFDSECKKLRQLSLKKEKKFQIGDLIRFTQKSRSRFGIITSFIHPDGLYSDSYEKGYNGKDFLECIEILPKHGLPRRKDEKDKPYIFLATPEHSNECFVIPMDEDGGVRIKERKFSIQKKKTCADVDARL